MIPAHWTENDLSIDGIGFHYVRTGDGQKPPLVLAHGFSDDGLCWLQMALDRGMKVIVNDHHLLKEPLPDGVILVNHRQPGCGLLGCEP